MLPNPVVAAGVEPKAGLFAPPNIDPLLPPPNAEVVVAAGAPNPPNPEDPAVAVPPPKSPPPVVAAGAPKPPGFAPNALVVEEPKPVVIIPLAMFYYGNLNLSLLHS